ncbi:MAG: hypothetical protein ACLQAT_28810 [Candidatus Binataceae bacterium]
MATTTQQLLEEARSSLAAYAAVLSRGEFQLPPHIRYLVTEFEAIERGEQYREGWCIPPRHGKTTLGEYATAHYLGRYPTRSVIFVSYGAELSEHDPEWRKEAYAKLRIRFTQIS